MKYNKTHVIVIGAGYAGLLASVRLAMNNRRHQPGVQITLINPSEDFIEWPRLHQFAANQLIKRQPIEEVLKETGVLFIQAAVTSIDVDRKEVITEAGGKSQRLAYDYLMYTAGSTFEQDRVPGVRLYATP